MKKINSLVLACLLTAPAATAQTTVTVGDSTAPWIGFMNVFELDCASFVFNGGWGVPDLAATFDDGAGTVTMTAAPINDAADFWYIGGGMPGAPGNKCMEANLFNEVLDGSLAGQTLTFEGEVLSNTLTGPHTAVLFIRDFAPDFSSSNEASVVVTPGPFSVSLALDPAPGRPIQYGLRMTGPNVWPGDEPLFGSVVLGLDQGADNFAPFCFGDGSGAACPCGNNAMAGSGGGCANSVNGSAVLSSNNSASVLANDISFDVTDAAPNSFALLVSADNQLGGGLGVAGMPMSDGLRCVGGNLLRHGTRATDSMGNNLNPWGTGVGIVAQSGFAMGQVRHFQVFYRDQGIKVAGDGTVAGLGGGCGFGTNTSQGLTVTFEM